MFIAMPTSLFLNHFQPMHLFHHVRMLFLLPR